MRRKNIMCKKMQKYEKKFLHFIFYVILNSLFADNAGIAQG